MLVRTSKYAPSTVLSYLLFSCLVFAATFLQATTARAEELIIKRPGDHPVYSVELEPHAAFAFLAPSAGSDGFGVGGRATIPLVRNGFVSSINNSIGIGFGIDWLHYNGCYYYRNPYGDCTNLESFYIPVVMQWNFFLSTHWSVFAEPGLALRYSNWGDGCIGGQYVAANGTVTNYSCGDAPNRLTVDPFILFVGGRYHFSQSVSLTMRIGWPYASVGVSFFP